MVLIKKIPEREDGKLLIIGTTSKNYVLKDLEIVKQFDITLNVPLLGVEEIRNVLLHYKCEKKVAIEISEFIQSIAIKQLLLIIDMAIQKDGKIIKETVLKRTKDIKKKKY
jgi:ACR3 family arsenite efflux pump ArsB